MKEVWLTENRAEGLGELFQSTVREQMMSCNSWMTVMYDSHSLVYVIIKPVLFFHPVTVLLPVDHEHKYNFSKCWHTPWLLRKVQKKSANAVAGIMHCWIWFCSWAITWMKFVFSTVSWTRSKRTWGSPSSRQMLSDFSRSEVRIRLRKTFSGWWIRHASLTTPPVSWPNKKKRLNAKLFRCRINSCWVVHLYLLTWVLNARILDLRWGMMVL